jgi:hypothetical protein
MGLEKDITAICFLFFYFDLEYLNILQISEPLYAKMPPILLLVRTTVCISAIRNLFYRTMLQKFGRDSNCSLDYSTQVKNSSILQSKPK